MGVKGLKEHVVFMDAGSIIGLDTKIGCFLRFLESDGIFRKVEEFWTFRAF